MNVTQRITNDAATIRELLKLENRVGLDFATTDLPTTLSIMLCLIDSGSYTAFDVFTYLSKRGCPLDLPSIEFLLDQYDGDDVHYHLWQRDFKGDYSVLHRADQPMYFKHLAQSIDGGG